ncbi:MAG: group II intron reverse transcriptase/maturase [Verrucomicrobiota bacterium]
MDKDEIPTEENAVPQQSLLEAILDRDNLRQAWKRVRANKGAPGMDGMSTLEFPSFARSQMPRVMEWIRQGRYKPSPVKRVWIPKPDGTQRPLGVPTVLDRVIQQAIAQVLGPLFEVDFSESSFGFRPGRQAKAAVERISEAAGEGYLWGVDCDLKSYFDMVNHDLLMHRLSQRVKDKMVLRLIGKYLRAGIRHEDGRAEKTTQGVPQGGPLSPLLANIMLDPLDKRIEAMGLPFARYADDFLIVTKTKAEALVAMAAVKDYVEGKLKLIVNEDKSKVAPIEECDFLGFNVRGRRIRRTDKAAKRFTFRIHEITSRSRGISMRKRIGELQRYCRGWFHYFKTGLSFAEVRQWDKWIRRRIRLCYWKDWKGPRNRRKMLIRLGASPKEVKKATRSRKGYWRMSQNSIVRIALNNAYLHQQGVPSMRDLWITFKYRDQAKL